jgi:hypothetical protein
VLGWARHSDKAMGRRIRGSNPGRNMIFFFSETYRRALSPTEPPIQWVLKFFPEVKRSEQENHERQFCSEGKDERRHTQTDLRGMDKDIFNCTLIWWANLIVRSGFLGGNTVQFGTVAYLTDDTASHPIRP